MCAEKGSTNSASVVRPVRLLPVRFQPFLLAPTRRPLVGNTISEAIVMCMIEARRPTNHEVQAVAAKIWRDVQAGSSKIPWRDIVPGCARYRRMIAVACVALGDRQGTRSGRLGKPS